MCKLNLSDASGTHLRFGSLSLTPPGPLCGRSSLEEFVLEGYDDGAGDSSDDVENGNGERGRPGLNGVFRTLARALGDAHWKGECSSVGGVGNPFAPADR